MPLLPKNLSNSLGSQPKNNPLGTTKISKDPKVPISSKASPYFCNIINFKPVSNFTSIVFQGTGNQGETKNNVETSVSKTKIEPLAVFTLRASDLKEGKKSQLYSAAHRAFLEDRISQEFLTTIYDRIGKLDSKFLENYDSLVKKNLKSIQETIDRISLAFQIVNQANSSFSSKEGLVTISKFSLQKSASIGKIDGLLKREDVFLDTFTLLKQYTENNSSDFDAFNFSSQIDKMTRTTIVSQILAICTSTLRNGYSKKSIGQRVASLDKTNPQNVVLEDSNVELNLNLRSLSIEQNSLPYILDSTDTQIIGDYSSRKFFKNIAYTVKPARSAILLSSMVANEFLTSAGLARLSGTELGNRFGSDSQDYTNTFIGSSTGLSTEETKQSGSLVDYLVVSQQGNNRTSNSSNERRVLLLDGTSAGETSTYTNSSSAFLKSVVNDPLANKAKIYNEALTNAQNAFDTGMQFYKKLHSRDQEISILNPRKLYTRILEEVSTSMKEFLLPPESANKLAIAELAFFLEVSKSGKVASNNANLEINHVKRQIFKTLAASTESLLLNKSKTTSGSKAQDGSQSSKTIIKFRDSQKSLAEDGKIQNDAIFAGILIPASSASFTSIGKTISIAEISVQDVFFKMAADKESLVNRIAKVFYECHSEASKLSSIENGNSTFLNPLYQTRASNLDGGTILALLFESFLNVVEIFVNTALGKSENYNLIQNIWGAGDISNIDDKNITEFSKAEKIKLFYKSGPGTSSSQTYKALKLLVQGSKNDNFSSIKNTDGFIPDLDLLPGSTIITSKQFSPLSFDSFISFFYDLAKGQEVVFSSLSSCLGMLEYTYQQTRNLIDMSYMLSNEKSPTPEIETLRNFAKGAIGKNYLGSINDYTLEFTKRKVEKIKSASISSSKKLSRISRGEINCLEFILESISQSSSSDILFSVLGLPNGMIVETLEPQFQIFSQKSDFNNSFVKVETNQDGLLDDFSYQPVSRKFFIKNLVDASSFSSFENSPPKSVNEILQRVILLSGETGEEMLNKYSQSSDVKEALYLEICSFVMRRIFSLLTITDFLEENLVSMQYLARSKDSKQIASLAAKSYNLPTSIFDQCFQQNGTNNLLDEEVLLDLTVPKTKTTSDGFQVELPKLTFGEAELFCDLFSSVPFLLDTLEERIFSPGYFDKVLSFFVDRGQFLSADNSSKDVIVGGVVTKSDDAYSQGFSKSDSTQGSISINSYSFLATAENAPVVKQ